MENRLHLYTPKMEDLWYRKRILSDPDTMSYNKGYHLRTDHYNNDTGCIVFPESEWHDWFAWFVRGAPNRYYAYIVRNEDNVFIGEVNLHMSTQGDWYDMGIVIESKYRGLGYAVEALQLLLRQAFEVFHANAVHNDFESVRGSAVKAHLSAGFSKWKEENGILGLAITQAQYSAR